MVGLFFALSLKDKILDTSYDSRWTLLTRDPDNNFIKEFCAEDLYIRTKSSVCTKKSCCERIIVDRLFDDMIKIIIWRHSSILERLFQSPKLSYPELMRKYKRSAKN